MTSSQELRQRVTHPRLIFLTDFAAMQINGFSEVADWKLYCICSQFVILMAVEPIFSFFYPPLAMGYENVNKHQNPSNDLRREK